MNKTGSNLLAGTFTLPAGQELHGNLTLREPASTLAIYAKEFIKAPFETPFDVHGTLYDQTKVSLLECIISAQTFSGKPEDGGRHHSVNIRPHFVLTGDESITSIGAEVRAVHFEISDATALFFDAEAFGMVLDPQLHIDKIVAPTTCTSKLSR